MSSKEGIKVAKLYVDIDSLLDTRLGTLNVISPEFAVDVTSKDDYFTREEDLFSSEAMGKLPKDIFDRVFEQYRNDILPNSLRTRMFEFIENTLSQLAYGALNSPEQSATALEVNIHPYVLAPEEELKILQVIATILGRRFTVSLINKSVQELEIEYVREHYRVMVMYSYHPWMNHWDAQIKKKPLKDTGLYVPRLWKNYKPEPAALQQFAEFNTDPFEFLHISLAPFVVVQFLPIAFWCANTPSNKASFTAA